MLIYQEHRKQPFSLQDLRSPVSVAIILVFAVEKSNI